MKVFIVDDSAIVRERPAGMLSETKGVEAAGHAENVPNAIESVKRIQPDVVILNIQIPGGSGIRDRCITNHQKGPDVTDCDHPYQLPLSSASKKVYGRKGGFLSGQID